MSLRQALRVAEFTSIWYEGDRVAEASEKGSKGILFSKG